MFKKKKKKKSGLFDFWILIYPLLLMGMPFKNGKRNGK